MIESRLRRMQWVVRATLVLGVAASVTANVLHARPNPISQAIAAWPPLALLITVELVTRIPVHRRALGVVRIVATSAIAGIAAWVSYHHMVGVVAHYGETGTVPYLLPLSVDGLVIVASVSLVELAGRRRDTGRPPRQAPAEVPAATPAPSPAWALATASVATPATSGATMSAPVTTAGPPPTTAGGPLLGLSAPLPEPVPAEAALPSSSEADATGDGAAGDGADGDDCDADPHGDHADGHDPSGDAAVVLAADLVPLLPAARAVRDELAREGRALSRDALARRLRRNGHSIRNNRVSELLAALRQETRSANGSRPAAPGLA